MQGLSPYTRGNPELVDGETPSSRHKGLSPYTRGNPCVPYLQIDGRVYPRTHGETLSEFAHLHPRLRVYPRTHGETRRGPLLDLRSIPVHTGKPVLYHVKCGFKEVYPRTHGETYLEVLVRFLDGQWVYPRTHGET